MVKKLKESEKKVLLQKYNSMGLSKKEAKVKLKRVTKGIFISPLTMIL